MYVYMLSCAKYIEKNNTMKKPNKVRQNKKTLISTFYILQLEYVHWVLSYFLMQFWKFSNIS